MKPAYRAAVLAACLLAGPTLPAAPEVINLWPGPPPGDTVQLPPETNLTRSTDHLAGGRPYIRLGNISTPTITVYPPPAAHNTGTAAVVCPGGGYRIVSIDLEGTEICDWLNSLGVTAVLLKYRVPAREGEPRYLAPLQDAQRALGLVRAHAGAWGIDPHRVGVIGFSAGGDMAAILSNDYAERAYPPVDAADRLGCRPDFTLLIYPAYLVGKDNVLAPEVKPPHAPETPPTFLVQAEDDPIRVENAFYYYLALHRGGVAAELHLYPTGGHGYGLRRTDATATTWPDRAADWLKAGGWLAPAP